MNRILRYSFPERLMHALSSISYIYLLLTGLAFWTPAFYWIAIVLGALKLLLGEQTVIDNSLEIGRAHV